MSHIVPTLRLALCLYPGLTPIDFLGPAEVFLSLNPKSFKEHPKIFTTKPAVLVDVTYFSHNLEPVIGDVGPGFVPQRTYKQVLEKYEQYDLVLVPGGISVTPATVDPSLIEFLKKQAHGAKYVLSVCSGAYLLASTGWLNKKCATTNKSRYREIVAGTDKSIKWVPKARWVVDGNTWTSSGVTAGIDMASAFLEFLAGKDYATSARIGLELIPNAQDDDPFAKIHGLVCD